MEKRKLASVQYIHHITPIEGADRIECVHVLGWQCVANKGQFRVGESCVYMEVDSSCQFVNVSNFYGEAATRRMKF